jgi:ABC-type transport system involved in cytochrome c biogenesis permease subunit
MMHSAYLLAVLFATSPAIPTIPEAKLPGSLDLSTIRALPVQHDGRWMPLDTLARDLVREVTGETRFRGHDPVTVLLAWAFDRTAWMQQPMIGIRNAELRAELGLPADRTMFSFTDLLSHEKLLSLMEELERKPPGRKPDSLESKVNDISEKLMALQQAFGGQSIRLIPDAAHPAGAWRPIPLTGPESSPEEASARDAWAELGRTFLADDASGFAPAGDKLSQALAALPAAYRPSPELIATELDYNRLRPFHIAWIAMAVGAVLAAIALGVGRRWFDALALLPLIAGFVVLTYGLGLRWQIAGSFPASNMYESLLFLGWGMGLFAILTPLVFRQRLVLLTASGMGALAVLLADVLPLDPFVRPVMPALLDTIWMAIHVPVIMVSYSVLALGVLIAHVQLGAMAVAPQRRSLSAAIDSLHYWYVHVGSILLAAGIITGSMWAASSWGRYWGWDPKEVWSLVALLGYLTILHTRLRREQMPLWAYLVGAALTLAVFVLIAWSLTPHSVGTISALAAALAAVGFLVLAHGPFATAVKSILCFWMVLMTYVGVNYVLGIGLHSYGFGTGAVARNMLWIGGIDLALVGAFGAVYSLRRAATEAAPPRAEPVAAR